MKRELVLPSVLVLWVLIASGCTTTDPDTGRERLGYLSARCYDFMDILELNLGVDAAFSLYAVGAVEPVAVGGGLYEAQKFGMDGRLFGQWKETRAEIDAGIESFIRYQKEPRWGNRYLFDSFYCPHQNVMEGEDVFYEQWGFSHRLLDHERRLLDVTAEVHLFAIGVDLGLSPMETLDFIFGLFGVDVIADDDWVAPLPKRTIPFFQGVVEEVAEEVDNSAAEEG